MKNSVSSSLFLAIKEVVGFCGALLRDIGYCTKALLHRPGFTLAAGCTLALAITATTLAITIIDGVLFRPLPYPDPHRLVNVWQTNEAWREAENLTLRAFASRFPASYPVFEDWRSRMSSFQSIGVYRDETMTLTATDYPEQLNAVQASAGVFETLDVKPELGQTFSPASDRVGGARLAVLSFGLWQRRFGGEADVLGKTLQLSGESYTVVGVMPQAFRFPNAKHEIWVTLGDEAKQRGRGSQFLRTIARLQDGSDLSAAARELEVVTRQLAAAFPDTQGELGARMAPHLEEIVGDTRHTLLILLAAAMLVLLVACANVANLMLVRSAARGRELAIRTALGASRVRLIRLLLCESLLLGIGGGIVGVAAAAVLLDPLLALLPASIPRAEEITLDGRVLSYSVAVSIGASLLVGIIPAAWLIRTGLIGRLQGVRTVGGGRHKNRVQGLFTITELATALVLLVATGLLVLSLIRISAVNPGFDDRGVVVAEIAIDGSDHRSFELPQLFARLRQKIAELPGVEGVAVAENVPFIGGSSVGTVELQLADGSRATASTAHALVSDAYFDTLGIALIQGRSFASSDGATALPVAVISRSMAERYWGSADPVGQRFRDPPERDWRTVIGVVDDVRHGSLAEAPQPRIYTPISQAELDDGTFVLVVRTEGDPAELIGRMREAVWAVAPQLPVPRVARLSSVVGESLATPHFRSVIIGMLALLAGVLAITGVYAVVAYRVSSRTAEAGLRMTLGASPRRVALDVVTQGMRLGMAGVILGIPASLMGARLLQSYLYEVEVMNPGVIGAAAMIVAAASALAAYIPARRAARIAPIQALRHE